jgi:hypothetical protein
MICLSVVQDHVQQRAVDAQTAVVFDEAELAEFVREKAHRRPGGADHLSQGFLANLGNRCLRSPLLPDGASARGRYGYSCNELLNDGCNFSQPWPDIRTGRNRRRFVEDRLWPASNIRPLCPPEHGEGRLDLLLTRGFPGEPFVDRCQFIRCCVISGTGRVLLRFRAQPPPALAVSPLARAGRVVPALL